MASIGHDPTIPIGVTSHLPISEERAGELARTVARSLDDVRGVEALCELLLGIAPDIRATMRERMTRVGLILSPEDATELISDLWQRYIAALHALEAMFSHTPEFDRAFREYVENLHQTPDKQGGEA